MGKAWRIVLTAVVFLMVAGVLLGGVAWLTGASPARIVELSMNGPEGVETWWSTATQAAESILATARAGVRGLF